MFLSGSFAVTLQCSHQCDHSVPGLEILKEPKRCTKDVPHQYICSVLGVFLQCTAFGKIWGNSGNTASTFQMFQVLQFSWHVLAVSPEFPQKQYTAVSGIDFRNLFFRLFYLTFHIPSLYFHSYRTQSRPSRPPDVATTSCSIPRNGLRTTRGRNP